MDTDAWNRKHGRSTILGKEMFLDLNESREGFCRRGRGRSYTKISTAIYIQRGLEFTHVFPSPFTYEITDVSSSAVKVRINNNLINDYVL